MLPKLQQYEPPIYSERAEVARILDPRFPNDMRADYNVLIKYFSLPEHGLVED